MYQREFPGKIRADERCHLAIQNAEDDTLDIEDAIVQLKEAEEERNKADEKLKTILKEIGVWNEH